MSGLPFNPMRKTPPPPPHMDTVGLTPTDYILVVAADGHVFVVHRECLSGSPALRRAFAKRFNVMTDDVVVLFDATAEALHASTSPWDQPTLDDKARVSAMPAEGGETGNLEVAFSPTVDGSYGGGEAAHDESTFRPISVNESLQNDRTIVITFPNHSAAVVDLLVAYLYYKQRYDGAVQLERPPFQVPKEHAIDVMKLAKALEC